MTKLKRGGSVMSYRGGATLNIFTLNDYAYQQLSKCPYALSKFPKGW